MNQQKAILLVSFGTSYEDSRRKTIDKILEEVTEAFPNYRIYQAWTSKMILRSIEKKGQYSYSYGGGSHGTDSG